MRSRFRTRSSPLLNRFECLPSWLLVPLFLYASRLAPYQYHVLSRRRWWDSSFRIGLRVVEVRYRAASAGIALRNDGRCQGQLDFVEDIVTECDDNDIKPTGVVQFRPIQQQVQLTHQGFLR